MQIFFLLSLGIALVEGKENGEMNADFSSQHTQVALK